MPVSSLRIFCPSRSGRSGPDGGVAQARTRTDRFGWAQPLRDDKSMFELDIDRLPTADVTKGAVLLRETGVALSIGSTSFAAHNRRRLPLARCDPGC
jgi:hypothetical protein